MLIRKITQGRVLTGHGRVTILEKGVRESLLSHRDLEMGVWWEAMGIPGEEHSQDREQLMQRP